VRTVNTLKSTIFQISEMDHVYNALQFMLTGRLTHFLITHKTLLSSLDRLEQFLSSEHPELTLVQRNVKYYYETAEFKTFRYGQHLIVILAVPLTTRQLLNPLSIYELKLLPLASPVKTDKHYTMLNVNFYAVAYNVDSEYYLVIDYSSQLPSSDIIDLRHSELILQSRSVQSCPLALLEGNLQLIKALCRYKIINTDLPKGLIKLHDNMILVSNIDKVTITCRNVNYSQTIELSEMQIVFKLHCGCYALADNFYLVETSLDCSEEDNLTLSIKPQFIMNIPFLSGFVEDDVTNILKDDVFLNFSIPSNFPKLKIAADKFDAIMGLDTEAEFDMETIINETLKDKEVFSGLSSYILNILLKTQTEIGDFDIFNAWNWISVVTSTIAVIAFILAIILHFKMKTLFLLMSSANRVSADQNILPTLFAFKSTTAVAPKMFNFEDYIVQLKKLFPMEVSILLCLVFLVIIFMVYLLSKIKRRVRSGTTLILELGNETEKILFKVADLAYGPSFYRFTVSRRLVRVVLHEFFFSGMLEWQDGLELSNMELDMNISLKRNISVRFWQVRKVKKLLRIPHFVLITVLDSAGQIRDLVILRPFNKRSETSLYPTRELEEMQF